MCGRCRQVFNAFQSLSRVEDVSQFHNVDSRATAAEREPNGQMPAAFSATEKAIEPVADRLFLREEPSPFPATFSASESLPQATRATTAQTSEFAESSTRYIRLDEHSAEASGPPVTGVLDLQLREPAIDLSGEHNPLLAEAPASRAAPMVATSKMWRLGVFVLFVGLIAQAAYAFRTALVATYPQLRPTVGEFCELAGCSLSWGRDEAALKIEASELIEAPGKPGRILLTAILVNRGKTKQDLPSLELRLTDNANQVVVSRLLNPADYLGRVIAKDEGLVPNTELYVNVDLKLELSSKPPASGYGLVVFYP